MTFLETWVRSKIARERIKISRCSLWRYFNNFFVAVFLNLWRKREHQNLNLLLINQIQIPLVRKQHWREDPRARFQNLLRPAFQTGVSCASQTCLATQCESYSRRSSKRQFSRPAKSTREFSSYSSSCAVYRDSWFRGTEHPLDFFKIK